MVRQSLRILGSLFLIGLGVLFLLINFNVITFTAQLENWFWLVMFGLAGLGFLAVFVNQPSEQWWAVIPSFTLLGLALLVGNFFPADLGGGVFLGMIGLSFWVIAFVRPEQWWAVIPGGTLVTLAVVAGLGSLVESGYASAAALFLGLAATFLLLYLRPGSGVDRERTRWAIWPAGILGVIGVMMLFGVTQLVNYAWGVFLILGGGLLIFRAMRRA